MRNRQHLTLSLLTGIILITTLLVVCAQPLNAHVANDDQLNSTRGVINDTNAVTLTHEITAATPVINEALQVTVTLTNRTISTTVDSPHYALRLESEGGVATLAPARPQVRHDLTLAPGETDTALFALYPLTGGEISLAAQVTVTIQLSPAGSTVIDHWTDPITLAVPMPSQAVSIIYETAYREGCMDDLALYFRTWVGDTWGEYDCSVAVGHLSGTYLNRAVSPTAARAEFNAARGDLALEPFHCHASYAFTVQVRPITHSGHGWTAGEWVNISHAADDTRHGGAESAAERIYTTMTMRDLLDPCIGTYVPIVSR